jgi:antitoxin VapB
MEMRKAKLFKNGQSQAVRLPREFRLAGDEVYVKHVGNAVLLIPVSDGWASLEQSLAMFVDFMPERNQPDKPDTREGLADY